VRTELGGLAGGFVAEVTGKARGRGDWGAVPQLGGSSQPLWRPPNPMSNYFFLEPLLDAFNGLIFVCPGAPVSSLAWVAKLQWLVFHFTEGFG